MIFPKLNISSLYAPLYGKLRQFDEDLLKVLNQAMTNLANIFEHSVNIVDNLDCQILTYTSNGVANTEDTVAHTLKRVPTGFIVVNLDKSASIYSGGTAWTSTAVYLKSSAATTVAKIIVF